MEKIIKALLDIREIKFRIDDDFTDRLNRHYTSSLLVMFAVLVSARQYMGDPIHCWCPEQCASNHEKYANIYCWVSDTYYVKFNDKMPQDELGKHRRITYYQWVPLILIGQSFLFFVPCIFWRFLNKRSGINIAALMEAAQASQRSVYADSREKTIRFTVHIIDRFLMTQCDTRTGCMVRLKHTLSKHCFLVYGRFYGNYLSFSYILVKLVYVGNAVAQMFLLGEDWDQSERFPRVTLCDFHIRQNTNVHRYTVQCVLPINLFNEKIFILLWFWLLIVSGLTIISLFHWLHKSIYWPGSVSNVKKQIRAMDSVQREAMVVKKFVENYLRRDGLFILRLIGKNAGDLVATEILVGLWESYGPKRRLLADGKGRKTAGLHSPSSPGTLEVV